MTGYASEYQVPKQSTVVTQPSVVKFVQRTQYTHIYPPCMSLYMFQLYIFPIHIQIYIYILLYIYIRITIIKLLYTVSIAPVFFFETPLKFDEVITQMIHFFFMKSRFWWNKSPWSSRFHGQQWSNGSSQIKAGPPEALPLVVPLGFHCPGGWDDFRGLCHGACPMGTCIKYAW